MISTHSKGTLLTQYKLITAAHRENLPNDYNKCGEKYGARRVRFKNRSTVAHGTWWAVMMLISLLLVQQH